jgi:hypothetical protein
MPRAHLEWPLSFGLPKTGCLMWPRWLVPRFGIRTLLLAVAAIAVGLWSYLYLPDTLHNRQDRLSRAAIDPYELSIAVLWLDWICGSGPRAAGHNP